MKTLLFALPLAAIGLGAALAPAPTATITVRNKLKLARRPETISLPLAQLTAASLRVHETKDNKLLVS